MFDRSCARPPPEVISTHISRSFHQPAIAAWTYCDRPATAINRVMPVSPAKQQQIGVANPVAHVGVIHVNRFVHGRVDRFIREGTSPCRICHSHCSVYVGTISGRHARTSSYRSRCSGRRSKRVDPENAVVRRSRCRARAFFPHAAQQARHIHQSAASGTSRGRARRFRRQLVRCCQRMSPSAVCPRRSAATEPRLTPIIAAIFRWLCVFVSKSRWISATTFGAIIVRPRCCECCGGDRSRQGDVQVIRRQFCRRIAFPTSSSSPAFEDDRCAAERNKKSPPPERTPATGSCGYLATQALRIPSARPQP